MKKTFSAERIQAEQKNLIRTYGAANVQGNAVTIDKSEIIQITKEGRVSELTVRLEDAYDKKLRAEEEIKFLEAELEKVK